jgi:hypothetical protein
MLAAIFEIIAKEILRGVFEYVWEFARAFVWEHKWYFAIALGIVLLLKILGWFLGIRIIRAIFIIVFLLALAVFFFWLYS